MAPNQSSSVIDLDSPSVDGYAADTYEDNDHSATLFETEAASEANSVRKFKANSNSKNQKANAADAKSEKKSPSAVVAKEKRPREKGDEGEVIPSGNENVLKKIKKKKAVKETKAELTAQGTVNADDHVVEKHKEKKIKKKEASKETKPKTAEGANANNAHALEKKKKKKRKKTKSAEGRRAGDTMKASDDGDAGGDDNLKKKEEQARFSAAMEECKRHLASHAVDWSWIREDVKEELAKLWVKVRAAKAKYLYCKAEFDRELHHEGRNAYVS